MNRQQQKYPSDNNWISSLRNQSNSLINLLYCSSNRKKSIEQREGGEENGNRRQKQINGKTEARKEKFWNICQCSITKIPPHVYKFFNVFFSLFTLGQCLSFALTHSKSKSSRYSASIDSFYLPGMYNAFTAYTVLNCSGHSTDLTYFWGFLDPGVSWWGNRLKHLNRMFKPDSYQVLTSYIRTKWSFILL